MEKVETRLPITLIEGFQTFGHHPEVSGVVRTLHLIRIGVIREEAEEQIVFLVGQVPDFQLLHLGPDGLRGRQHHGHDHQGSKGVRNARRFEVHLGQGAGRKQPSDQIIQYLERELAGGNQQQEADHHLDPECLGVQTQQEDQRDEESGQEAQPKKVYGRMMAFHPSPEAKPQPFPAAYKARQLTSSFTNQIGPHVVPVFIVPRLRYPGRRQVDGPLGDLVFRLTGPAGQLFNRPSIAITGFKIHAVIDTGGIQSKQPLHAG